MMKTQPRRNRTIQINLPWVLCIFSLLALALSSAAALPQTGAKRHLTHSDYDGWRSIQFQQVHKDGKMLAYALTPQDGDGEVVVRNLATGKEFRHSRGSRQAPTGEDITEAPPIPPAGGGRGGRGGFGAAGRNSALAFTGDGRALVFQIAPTKAENEKARKEKKRPDEMPKNALGIMDLATGEVTRVERVKSFQVPEEGSGFIAYQLEAKAEERPAGERGANAGAAQASAGRGGQGRGRGGARRPEYGSDLVLRNMTDKSEHVFPDASEYIFTKDAKSLVYSVASRKAETNGVYAVSPGGSGEPTALLAGKGKYTNLTRDEKQTELAFLSDRDDAAAKQPKTKLYLWDRKAPAATELVSSATPGFRQGFVISDRGAINFSADGSRVFFGIAQPPDPEPDPQAASDDTPADEKVVVDLWNWKDDFIQPMQKVRVEQTRNRSYRAVFHLKEKKLVQLADETLEGINPTRDGRWALGTDDRAYRRLVGFDSNYSDFYLVNTLDGSRKPLKQKQSGGLSWSPTGKYALFYDDKDWNSISIPDGKVVNLTKNLGINFWREDHDSPSPPPSYGNGGWTRDEKYVLLYDQFDIWQVAADGSGAKNLTDRVGRKEQIVFRYVRLDDSDDPDRAIDPSKPLLLSAENEVTRDSGFYRDRIDGGMPEKLIMTAKDFGNPMKAKEADVVVLTQQTFNEFPDLMVTDSGFKGLKKVSNANPQKSGLLWGTAELVQFNNVDGVPLRAILMKPENFDPNKKYPMMVYIYEKLTQNLNRFVNPAPGTSINAAYYVSNGYLVLEPDIVYTIGYPGPSALKCVLPAVQAVVDKGFVNEKAIGIQGHSWGGYQIAYMITQTNRFRAVEAGAPVSNMTSAYSGIRWETGLPRQFQYEHTQSRIGGSLWEYPLRFLENSAIFRADRVQTPLLMIANDNDGAVPWYQGIEYYLALRRLGKEVYMFNYNGEPHGLRKRPNQKDYTRRMAEFFDHFLKSAPKPEWMEKGIPFIEREKEKEKYKPVTDEKEKIPSGPRN